MNRILSAALAITGALLVTITSASAQAPFSLEGRTIRILVPNAAGGINDTEGRLVEAHIGRFLPGNPSIVVQNLPGAGGERMLEFVNQTDPADNLMIAMVGGALIFRARAGDLPNFDPRAVNWIGSIPANVHAFMVATATGITRPEELIGRTITAATISAGGTSYIYYLLLNRTLGFGIRPIAGYDGMGTMTLALDRHEVDALMTPYSSYSQFVQPLVDADKARLLFYLSLEDHPELGVPNILDMPLPPDQALILRTGVAGTAFGRPFMAPAGADPAFVALMRSAFDRMVADPAFLADAALRGIDVRYRDAAGIEAAVAELYAVADEVIDEVGAVLFAE